jgi:predicted enzyme related to lactoylglutathione lyase
MAPGEPTNSGSRGGVRLREALRRPLEQNPELKHPSIETQGQGERGDIKLWYEHQPRTLPTSHASERAFTVPPLEATPTSGQDSGMERVLGIGGYFLRAGDPAALGAWYRDCLGSRAQQTMLNLRVRDLDAMLVQLRAKVADVADETQDIAGVGRFGWVTDPEGNRVELWQPA